MRTDQWNGIVGNGKSNTLEQKRENILKKDH